MTKPKTGKIITDGDILKEVADAEWHDTVGAVKIAIRLARQQGIAQGKCNGCICKSMAERAVADNDIYHQGLVKGRAEQDKRRDIPNKNRQSMAIYRAEKQAYEKGKADGKKEVLLNEKVYLKRINQVEQILKYQHNEMEKKYLEGRKDGVADFKAKLLNPELKEILRKRHHCPKNNYGIQMMLEEALAEAERK